MKLAILDRIGLRHMEGEDSMEVLKNWVPQDGALDAVAQLNHAGWTVVVANNQPGLGRGSVDLSALNQTYLRMHRELSAAGARVDAVFFCPHAPDDDCLCRAPASGLFEQIATRYGVQTHEIWVVAQELKYLQAARKLNANLVQLSINGVYFDTATLGVAVVRFDNWSGLANMLTSSASTD